MACRNRLSTVLSRSAWKVQHCVPFSSGYSGVSSSVESVDRRRFARKATAFVLLSITGGFVLSAVDDLAVYSKCSSKALEKANNNEILREALGEPIVRGQWYNASLAVTDKKRSASCTFPIIGPQGSGMLQVKAVCNGENKWYNYLPGSREWEILFMEALVHPATNGESQQTFRINLMKNPNLSESKECKECKLGSS